MESGLEKINQGIELLEKAMKLAKKQQIRAPEQDELDRSLSEANKVLRAKQEKQTKDADAQAMTDLKQILDKLNVMHVQYKVPKQDRVDISYMKNAVRETLANDAAKNS